MGKTVEVGRSELKVGDVLLTKGEPPRALRIEAIQPGMNGYGWPYLTLQGENGEELEHDTSLDNLSATYTVQKVGGV